MQKNQIYESVTIRINKDSIEITLCLGIDARISLNNVESLRIKTRKFRTLEDLQKDAEKGIILISKNKRKERIIMNWKKESELFNKTADYYDKYRPSYPQELIDILIQETQIKENSYILEVGSGSGKATELLVGRGYNILGIDPGEDLVRIGNDKFTDSKVKFQVGRFEEMVLPEEYYDVVFAAQSFHWVPQPIGYQKVSLTLKNNGYLALMWNMYVVCDNECDKELLELSRKYGGFADFLNEEQCVDRIDSITNQIENSGLFSKVKIFKKRWIKSYNAEEYFGFVKTGNKFIQKSDKEKEEAFHDITNLANKNNGVIERPFLCVLYLAKKLNNKSC